MSSPVADPVANPHPEEEDDPMQGSVHEEEGEGVGGEGQGGVSDDSSEEPEEDEEEERRIREGFIVDEDEDDDEDDEEERKRRRKKRRRHRREREREEEEALEEDDLDLLEENTGASFKHRLTRLRRAPGSPSARSSGKRKAVVESSDDDLDNDDLELPKVQDIHNIWDDERGGGRDDEDDADMDDLDNFIDDEDEDEQGVVMDEEEREERRRERRRLEKERRKAMGSRPELSGIDANAWDEIYEVFGDGHDYDWALVDDDEAPAEDEVQKSEMKYQDVFEPSEIKARMLTEDDDLIRQHDTPERMQLANSSLSQSSTLAFQDTLTENDLDDAASWVITRLSPETERAFFRPDGQFHPYLRDLVQAVSYALRFLFIQEFEVPYIWTHKKDYITYFNPENLRTKIELLSLEDLWRVYSLGLKYRSLVDRRKALDSLYARLGASDHYYENEIRKRVESVEMVADATEWVSMKYRDDKKHKFDMAFHDDEEQETKHWKAPSRVSAYEIAKKSVVSKLAEGFGIQPYEVVQNFMSRSTTHFLREQELSPQAFAEKYADPDPAKAQSPEELLRRARMILATELGKDPLLRQEMRNCFKLDALVSVSPTERGVSKIDEHHKYFNFKYLNQKRATDMLDSEQFLYILEAEAQHLVTVSITLPPEATGAFERRLSDAFASDSYSESARAWNEERLRVVQETLQQHLIPNAIKWTREWIREEAEDALSKKCAHKLRTRIDVAPYITPDLQKGDTASVLAMSWGKGDPHKDPITIVFLDEAGRLREHTRIDNLSDEDNFTEFKDILRRRQPNVIVLGGFSVATYKLQHRVKELLHPPQDGSTWGQPEVDIFDIPVIYVFDEVARMYQHSKRAAEEFSALSSMAKYCIGLARYVQSPLNEFAALGSDITAINLHDNANEEYQQLIPKEKLLTALERVLVDVTNKVGVDINRAVTDSYYQHLLPFVCGLGPRKAQVLVKKIAAIGGTLMNRVQFIQNSLLTTKIFLNAAGFLRITQDSSFARSSKNRHDEDSDVADPLDSTRIHPEDYELARKMAMDAQDEDEEDHQGEHPSTVVSNLLVLPQKEKILSDLNLDDFAVNMYQTNQDRKANTLELIREELVKPFRELRDDFKLPTNWGILTMLTGETQKTLKIGLIVSAAVLRAKQTIAFVKLDSGVEGVIPKHLLTESDEPCDRIVKTGQILTAVISNVKSPDEAAGPGPFTVELSARPSDVNPGDSQFRRVRHDDAWNHVQYDRDNDLQARKKRAEVDKTRRVIKHPNFHNFNMHQAEAYLEKQQRGDVVIRPSSKGPNHLAVTWKVEDGLYQHIDVVDADADPNGQSVGTRLIVDSTHQYSDLDELIVNHVQAMNRKVEELMLHDKFKPGPQEELHLFLKNFVAANPTKSAYGFSLNRKKPGHFSLCFLANKNSTVQTWPVRVTPEAYYLFETPAAGVPELCDAFKVRHLHESQSGGGAAGGLGGKTPYGGRTPARTPGPGASVSGHQTPGRMSVRNSFPSRTPNPYGGASSSTGLGGVTPYGAGYQTPGHPSRSSRPIAQDSGGWGGSGKW